MLEERHSGLDSLEAKLHYQFKKREFLVEALTHSSFGNEKNQNIKVSLPNNERLEFLGDAVLGVCIADLLMAFFPEAPEGKLSRWRSLLVSTKTLVEIANRLDLGIYVRLGKGEIQTGGSTKASILSSAYEALVGAVFYDGGFKAVHQMIQAHFEAYFQMLQQNQEAYLIFDKKTFLQERIQSIYKAPPLYRLVEAWGVEHEKFFKVEIVIDGRVIAQAEGRSKKDAEQRVAHLAIDILGLK